MSSTVMCCISPPEICLGSLHWQPRVPVIFLFPHTSLDQKNRDQVEPVLKPLLEEEHSLVNSVCSIEPRFSPALEGHLHGSHDDPPTTPRGACDGRARERDEARL